MRFYYKFIYHHKREINDGVFVEDPTKAINRTQLKIVQGIMFENWCRQHHRALAKIMKFDQIRYKSGSFFNRDTAKQNPGFQIDLLYIRDDARIVLCEIKYQDVLDIRAAGRSIQEKEQLFRNQMPKYKNYTFEKALIAPEAPKDTEGFDHTVSFNELFSRNL